MFMHAHAGHQAIITNEVHAWSAHAQSTRAHIMHAHAVHGGRFSCKLIETWHLPL